MALELADCTTKKEVDRLESAIKDNRQECIVKANRLEAATTARLEQNKLWARKAIKEIPPSFCLYAVTSSNAWTGTERTSTAAPRSRSSKAWPQSRATIRKM